MSLIIHTYRLWDFMTSLICNISSHRFTYRTTSRSVESHQFPVYRNDTSLYSECGINAYKVTTRANFAEMVTRFVQLNSLYHLRDLCWSVSVCHVRKCSVPRRLYIRQILLALFSQTAAAWKMSITSQHISPFSVPRLFIMNWCVEGLCFWTSDTKSGVHTATSSSAPFAKDQMPVLSEVITLKVLDHD